MKARRAMIAILAAGALIASACGDDDDNAESTTATTAAAESSSAPTTSTAATESTSAPTTASQTSAPSSESASESSAESSSQSATGSSEATAFDPSLPPVMVGFGTLEGGSYSLPETRFAFEAALDHINNEMGGVNGHELKAAVTCALDVTPESAVDCANKVVEGNVSMYIDGVDLAADAMLPIYKEAGILTMSGSVATPGVDAAVGDVVALGPSLEGGQLSTAVVQAANTGGTKIAYVLADIPAMHSIYDQVVPDLATQLGVETQVFYYPQPTDWTTFAPTVLSNGADYIVMFASDPDFLAAIAAFRGSGFTGTINANSFAQYASLDPALLENVIVASPFYNELVSGGVPDVAQADIDTYMRYHDQSDDMKNGSPSPTRSGWYAAMMAADILRQVDDPTSAAAVLAQAPNASGRVLFSDQNYDCATPSWPNTTSCTGDVYYFSINADNTLSALPDQPVHVDAPQG